MKHGTKIATPMVASVFQDWHYVVLMTDPRLSPRRITGKLFTGYSQHDIHAKIYKTITYYVIIVEDKAA